MKKLLILILTAAMIFSGCSSNSAPEEAPDVEASVESAEESDKSFTMAVHWIGANLDTIEGWNGWVTARIGAAESLVKVDEDMQVSPVLAESYTVVDDRTVEFVIRNNAFFHNGEKVDAKAAKKSIERTLSDSDRSDLVFEVEEIKADGQVLTVVAKDSMPILLNVLADPCFSIVYVDGVDEATFDTTPICTGPFKITEYIQDGDIQLVRHDQHWYGKTNVETVTVKHIQDATTRAMALQSGELDYAVQVTATDLKLLEEDARFDILKGANLRINMLILNYDKPYMQELKFRQALKYGIDQVAYAEGIVGGIPAKGPYTEQLPFAYTGDPYYAYDPAKANALLDELGYVDTDGDGVREIDGAPLELVYLCSQKSGVESRNIGVAMQQQYKEIGIALDVQQVENYYDLRDEKAYDLCTERWSSAPTGDSQNFLESAFHTEGYGNVEGYSNAEFDALITELSKASNIDERNELGKKGTEMLIEDVSALFLYYEVGNVVTTKRVSGVYRYPSEVFYIDERLMVE